MPSRKRGKGKARKAKAKAAATNANVAASNELGTPAQHAAALPTTISRQGVEIPTALIPELNQLMGGLSLSETKCNHGLPPLPPATTARAFLLAFDAIAGKIAKTSSDYTVRFSKVMDGVFRLGLESVLYDLADREALLAGHVSLGVACLVERQEEPNSRSIAALHAMAVYNLGCPDGSVNEIIANARDLAEGGERTIVKFFAQRISCNCLAERYEASKKESKVAICANCSETMERSKLLLCGGCKLVHYDCQKQDWYRHKFPCKMVQKGVDAVASGLLSSTTNP